MKVIVLDTHPVEDGRIIRHLNYLVRNNINTLSIHFNIDNPCLPEGHFSRVGEKGYRVNIIHQQHEAINQISLFANFTLLKRCPNLFRIIDEYCSSKSEEIIIHIHNPTLLLVAVKIRSRHPNCKIVYDRHELCENNAKGWLIKIPSFSRVLEYLTKSRIDGVITISSEHNKKTQEMFPYSAVRVVQNFPESAEYTFASIQDKISSFGYKSVIKCIYIGSLNYHFDRDIPLILHIAEIVLEKYANVTLTIGGHTRDPDLLQHLNKLSKKYPDQFSYLGSIPRVDVVKLTQCSHIGFFFIRPESSYWVKCSPNKVFEYIQCGAIPIVRADCDYVEDFQKYALIFDRDSSDEEIIAGTLDLLENPARMKNMMDLAFQASSNYSFETIAQNYIQLYHDVLQKKV